MKTLKGFRAIVTERITPLEACSRVEVESRMRQARQIRIRAPWVSGVSLRLTIRQLPVERKALWPPG